MPDMNMKRQIAALEEEYGINVAELRRRGEEARRKAAEADAAFAADVENKEQEK